MMKTHLVSVVIPVYNVEKYLRRCLDSVINQTYDNIEIILVDDGSTDSSGTICDEYKEKDSRVKVLHKTNGGLSDARNIGIDLANGKYITFIDSDDVISLDYIEYLYDLLIKNNSMISVCDYQLFKDNFKVKKQKVHINKYSNIEMLEYMLYGGHNLISAWAKLYDISLFEDIRYPKGCIYEDVYTTYLLYEKSDSIVVSDEKKYFYFVRSNSITNLKFSDKNYEILKSNDRMIDYLKKYNCLSSALIRRKVFSRISLLCKMILSGYNGEDKKELIDYIKNNKAYVLNNHIASKKDKIAIRILSFSPKLFEIVWKIYKKSEV